MYHVFEGGQGRYEIDGEVWCHLCQQYVKIQAGYKLEECPGPNEPCHVGR
jgi:hypothetical protein